MAKTKRMIQSHMALVDIVIELLDARIPLSSRNMDIGKLAGGKERIVILNKSDLADPGATKQWEAFFLREGAKTYALNARDKNAALKITGIARELMKEKTERRKNRGIINSNIRAMVAGIPNVGKSTFINSLYGRAGADTADRPGVTRGRQWIKLSGGLDLLDTPGILWPKFEDENVGIKLAVTGAVADSILDRVTLCEHLLAMLSEINPSSYIKRYKLNENIGPEANPRELLEIIGNARGFKLKGGVIDIERAAVIVLDEFRAGKLGRITLELPV